MCKINIEGRIAIYARVALHRNNNLEKQIDKIKKTVGVDCSNIYSEVAGGHDTTREGRKEWFRLLDDVEKNKITSIYLTGYDRIARDYILWKGCWKSWKAWFVIFIKPYEKKLLNKGNFFGLYLT